MYLDGDAEGAHTPDILTADGLGDVISLGCFSVFSELLRDTIYQSPPELDETVAALTAEAQEGYFQFTRNFYRRYEIHMNGKKMHPQGHLFQSALVQFAAGIYYYFCACVKIGGFARNKKMTPRELKIKLKNILKETHLISAFDQKLQGHGEVEDFPLLINMAGVTIHAYDLTASTRKCHRESLQK